MIDPETGEIKEPRRRCRNKVVTFDGFCKFHANGSREQGAPASISLLAQDPYIDMRDGPGLGVNVYKKTMGGGGGGEKKKPIPMSNSNFGLFEGIGQGDAEDAALDAEIRALEEELGGLDDGDGMYGEDGIEGGEDASTREPSLPQKVRLPMP